MRALAVLESGALCWTRQLWHDEATHNYGGGDANGNVAFKPRLPPINSAAIDGYRFAQTIYGL